jgi:hypothetical protein
MERPEAVLQGFARVVGTNPVVVLVELERLLGGGRAGVGVAVAASGLGFSSFSFQLKCHCPFPLFSD